MAKNINLRSFASMDWGGSNARAGVVHMFSELHGTKKVNARTELVDETYVYFSTEGIQSIQDVLRQSIGVALSRFDGKCDGISGCVASPVDDHRFVQNACNTKLLRDHKGFDLRKEIEEMFKIPAVVPNDLEAGLAGETTVGVLKGKKWATLQNIGTGWGASYLFNGFAVAAESGHIWLPGSDGEVECGCERKDCAEARYSGGAIEKRVIEECMARHIDIPQGMKPCAFADQEVLKGEGWALELYTSVAEAIGNIWGSNLNICPEFTDIVYQGSFIERAMQIEFFRQQVRESMLARSMNPRRHENIIIQERGAPLHESGESLGTLYGNAVIADQMIQ
ncbi:MAG: ROK family protein [Patescibacteria group bacterium]